MQTDVGSFANSAGKEVTETEHRVRNTDRDVLQRMFARRRDLSRHLVARAEQSIRRARTPDFGDDARLGGRSGAKDRCFGSRLEERITGLENAVDSLSLL
jgi:hypothetical protein